MNWIFYLAPVVAMIGGVVSVLGFANTIETSFAASRAGFDQ
ncbi:hypothetical protein FHS21_001292 [Phyllobacterium trifolii]|uniref:Uncharacterized protein n=1 Tax=Phyllobacterium trifolii TaxID=300193 RepID=A0A839U851_9HYPH|nr:hypothetical protein [Phyllobacterium trifolii]MBB3144891.1 hypothetical protein [Phyllobacterium trifolii]